MNVFGNFLVPAAAGTLFDDAALCRAMLDFESALARAQAQEEVIPPAAAQAIVVACDSLQLDAAALAAGGRQSGAMAVPLVAALAQALQSAGQADAVRYLHYGATTQDVVDTAQALMTRHALDELLAQVQASVQWLRSEAARHARTPMLARTLLQPAQVTSWGLKCAQWAAPLTRSHAQLRLLARRALALQLGGAVGNLSTLGEAGERVATRVAAHLGLRCAVGNWHTQRDEWMRLGLEVAVLAGSLSKIAGDLVLMSQAEVAEVVAGDAQSGGSSAMPHKRNPVACMQAVAACAQVPHLAATLLSTMAQAHERGMGEWQAEVAVWPQLWVQAFAAASAVNAALSGLRADPQRMARNIDELQGVVCSEALAHTLAVSLGKPAAAALVRSLGAQAIERRTPLVTLLLADPAVAALDASQRAALATACDPAVAVLPSARLCERILRTADTDAL